MDKMTNRRIKTVPRQMQKVSIFNKFSVLCDDNLFCIKQFKAEKNINCRIIRR